MRLTQIKLKKSELEKWLRFYSLSLLSGLLLSLSFPKFNLALLSFLALVPLFFTLKEERSLYNVFKKTFAFGLLHYVLLLYWLVYTLVKYGKVPFPLALLLLILLSLYLSLYWFFFGTLIVKFGLLREPSFLKGIFTALFLVLTEILRSLLLTGFPWGLLGYNLTNFPLLLQLADLTGVFGLSFTLTFINYFWFYLFEGLAGLKFRERAFHLNLLFFGVFIFGVLLYGKWSYNYWEERLKESKDMLRVSLLQGNIPQELKEAKEIEFSLETYQNLTLQALREGPDLMVFPETALPFYFPYDREPTLKFLSLLERVKAEALSLGLKPPAIIFGTFRVSFETNPPEVRNSLLVWNEDEISDLYDKEKLVPFGEYVPLARYFPFLKRISVVSDIIRPGISKNLRFKLGERVLEVVPLICFESAFPELMLKRLKGGGDLVVVVTNDAWFGKTSAPYQHFQMAIVRAVEARRFLLHTGNTGITGIIDPLGRVIIRSDLEREEIISGSVKILKEKYHLVKIGERLFP